MDKGAQKIVQYLNEAHASEQALISVLGSQIAMTPRGRYREDLEDHRSQTREHASRLERRLGELGQGHSPIHLGIGLLETVIGQALALGKTPLDLLRGSGGEEKILKNAKDACATEALEIATYTALEQLAESVGDETTAELARSIRRDEERMLDRVLAAIPRLARDVARAEVQGIPSYELGETGAADAGRDAARKVKETAQAAASGTKKAARQARKVPGVAQAEGQLKGAVASEQDLAIAGYGDLTAAEIVARLDGLSQIELAKIDSFERRHENRTTVLSRITSLRGSEPWPGYDELAVEEIRGTLNGEDATAVKRVRSYERSHKKRKGVIEATDRASINV